MCRSMVDISNLRPLRISEEKKKTETAGQKYNGLALLHTAAIITLTVT